MIWFCRLRNQLAEVERRHQIDVEHSGESRRVLVLDERGAEIPALLTSTSMRHFAPSACSTRWARSGSARCRTRSDGHSRSARQVVQPVGTTGAAKDGRTRLGKHTGESRAEP